MSKERLKVLLIEDDPEDAMLIRDMLADAGGVSFDAECAGCLSSGSERLGDTSIDVVLVDLGLPDSTGLATLDSVMCLAPATPVVVLTGLGDEQVALDAVHRGAQDYLVKGKFESDVLSRCVRYAIERHQLKAELERARLDCSLQVFAKDSILSFSRCYWGFCHSSLH